MVHIPEDMRTWVAKLNHQFAHILRVILSAHEDQALRFDEMIDDVEKSFDFLLRSGD